nr:NAD(P)-binding domain-containing protein [Candidatus Neptunochlamydia vexilliferae]
MERFQWGIIGAGPAGIAAIGKLIDQGVDAGSIAWVDPDFQVGDLGQKWRAVSSNTSVKLFLDYLNICPAFNFAKAPHFRLKDLDPEKTCLLQEIADPLIWVTGQLREKVRSFEGEVSLLEMENREWILKTDKEVLAAKNVILATGAEQRKLEYPNLKEISLEKALVAEKLPDVSEETVAVFGSSHSAMIVIKNLLEYPAKKVINFHRSPLKFAVFFEDWVLFDNTGLKGETAEWVRKHIHGKYPEHLNRVLASDPEFSTLLSQCQSVVYAVGFERRVPPKAYQIGHLTYNESNGIVAPGLFGLGIGFPQKVEDRFGNVEYSVGLWKFMVYLDAVLPLWMRYAI